MIDHIDAMLHLGFPSWVAGAVISISFGLAVWSVYNNPTMRAFKVAAKRVACTFTGAVVVLSTLIGGVMMLAQIIIGYNIVSGVWRILGARSLRTFFHRLLLVIQRMVVTVVVVAIGVSVLTGGASFYGAPLFIAVAVLLFWTLKTNEASVDRRDRLHTVTRLYT